MVNVLDVKVFRDLWSMRTQVLSIALLIAAGIAVLVMSVSNYLALVRAMDAHYRNERFAEVFASLKRAPLSLVGRIRELRRRWHSSRASLRILGFTRNEVTGILLSELAVEVAAARLRPEPGRIRERAMRQ